MRSETIMEDGPPLSPERTMLATGVTINDGGNSLAALCCVANRHQQQHRWYAKQSDRGDLACGPSYYVRVCCAF